MMHLTLQPLKEAFEAAVRPFRHAETHSFVRYKLADDSYKIAEVAKRDVATLDIPQGAQAFYFFDAQLKPGQHLPDWKLLQKAASEGAVHYFADRMMPYRDFYKMDDEDKRKLKGYDNQSSWEDTRVAIDGDHVRFVNARFDRPTVIINRATHEQMWTSAERLPFVPKAALKA